MTDTHAEVQEILASRGIAVAGTNERAVFRDDALACVRLYQEGRTPVLGGDVYFVRDGQLEPAYANWCADRHANESSLAYIERSCEYAWSYIDGFPETHGRPNAFVIVVPDK
jgi:hypothetical protein